MLWPKMTSFSNDVGSASLHDVFQGFTRCSLFSFSFHGGKCSNKIKFDGFILVISLLLNQQYHYSKSAASDNRLRAFTLNVAL